MMCPFHSTFAELSGSGSCCFLMASLSFPTSPSPRNGIGVPIWSTPQVTAPNATLRAIFWGQSNQEVGSPADRAPTARGGVPNITQEKLKDWSVKDIAETLETGMTPDSDFVGGNMAEVVRSTAQLSAANREAIATYIKSLPAKK